jgi:hypothetical protein
MGNIDSTRDDAPPINTMEEFLKFAEKATKGIRDNFDEKLRKVIALEMDEEDEQNKQSLE